MFRYSTVIIEKLMRQDTRERLEPSSVTGKYEKQRVYGVSSHNHRSVVAFSHSVTNCLQYRQRCHI